MGIARSLGLIALLVVMGIVLVLVAQQWEKAAPAVLAISDPQTPGAVPDHGDTAAGAAIRSGRLPNLNDARQTTDAHAAAVQDAMAEIE